MANGIRSIQRAFQILRTMNEKSVWTLQELQKSTRLPKSTLHRILSTLRDEGYVRCDEGMYGRYQLTNDVLALSKGVTERSRLTDIAAPVLKGVTRRIRWPVSMGVIDGHKMRVSMCTMPYSPYAIRPSSYGRHYDLLTSALGKAYFSYCSMAERRILFDLLKMSAGNESSVPSWRELKKIIRATRCQGFSVRYGATPSDSSAIGVPVFADGQVVAAVCYSTFSGSLDNAQIEKYLPVLKQTAATIGYLYEIEGNPGCTAVCPDK